MVNILEYLENTVRVCPDKTAFFDEERALSFRQLFDQARGIGSWLSREGFYGKPVVVFLKRSPRVVAAFLGAIYGGCYYVPLDEEMPRHRIDLILKTLEPGLLLCDEGTRYLAEGLSWEGRLCCYEDAAFGIIDEAALQGIRARQLDIDPIYIVFTSGSTGIPKGVVGCHRAVIDYIENLCPVLKFDEDTVFGNQTPLYFDACLKEILPTLKYGASTCLIPKQMFLFPVQLVEFLNARKINTLCWVVSALTMISSLRTFERVKPQHLRLVAFASEVFPIRQLNLWRRAVPEARFVNLYGPTEATGICCYYEVDREFSESETLPAGRPFPNTGILLLDEKGQEPAPGEQGEICIRGTRLTLGYYADPERTAAAFCQNPRNPNCPERIYRTGDLGKFNERGELLFLGRRDQQIKHMGHRIELGEIETVSAMHPGVRQCCCLYDAQKKRLILCYVGPAATGELAAHIKGKLPRYMIPNQLRKMAALPVTPNGKLDRAGLWGQITREEK